MQVRLLLLQMVLLQLLVVLMKLLVVLMKLLLLLGFTACKQGSCNSLHLHLPAWSSDRGLHELWKLVRPGCLQGGSATLSTL